MFLKAVKRACLIMVILSCLVSLPLYAIDNIAWTPMTKSFYLNKPIVRNADGTLKGKPSTLTGWIEYRDNYSTDYSYDPVTDSWMRLASLAAFSIPFDGI